MSLPSVKELKKLAKACRQAGIKTFKAEGIEFTLTDEEPTKTSKKAVLLATSKQGDIQTDNITEEELMFWSAGLPTENTPAKGVL